ncbi:hypothetical protein C8F01DRAFT_1164428 [Mycena amicta]|nr:hypothetical protein C8F01DRAFT_1164428 [Mycena amicta]
MSSSSSTPIRAITTPLRSPTPAPIPPADKLYEPHAKAVLRRRLTNRVFVYTAVVSAASSCVWVGLSRAAGAAVVLWAGGLLPLVILRKTYLTVSHTSAASPVLLIQKSLAPPLRVRTLHALQAHLFSALCILALHATLDSNVPIFIKSRKHPYTFHPVLLLFALNQSVLACLCVLRAILRDVWVFPFRRPTLIPSLGTILAPAILSLLALPIALTLAFVVIPILRRVPILSLALAFTRTPHLSVLRYTSRIWTLGLLTSSLWEIFSGIWAWVIGEELGMAPAVRTLVSGISISGTPAPSPSSYPSSAFSTPSSLARSSPFLSQLASAKPSTSAPAPAPKLSCTRSHSRLSESPNANAKAATELFDVDGLVWSTLAREALILLGREYQLLLGRGVAPPPPAPPPQAPVVTGFSTPSRSNSSTTPIAGSTSRIVQTPLIKQNIFAPKSAPSSPAARVGEALASGETLEGIVGPVVDGLSLPEINLTAQLQSYLPEVNLRKYLRLPGWAHSVLDVSLPKTWTQRRMERTVREWVPRSEVCVEAVEVLTHFTSASLTVDRFGVAQRDIPRILEALLAFLGAIETAQAELRGKAEDPNNTSLEDKADLDAARVVLGNLGDVLKDGVARLRAFKFPPRTAVRLQEFVDYSVVG